MIQYCLLRVIKLPATIRATEDTRKLRSNIVSWGRSTCPLLFTQPTIQATDDTKAHPHGDKPASFHTTQPMMHASYDPIPSPRGDKPASYDTHKL